MNRHQMDTIIWLFEKKHLISKPIEDLLDELELPYERDFGYHVSFPGTNYGLSIQIDRETAGRSLCETALKLDDELTETLGYTYCLPRWSNIDELRQHLVELKLKITSLSHE